MVELRGFKFVTTLVLVLKEIKQKHDTFYSHSKAETINESDTDDNVFKSIYTTITSNTKLFRKRFGLDHWFSIRNDNEW